ncbi:hypothetical protein PR202_ga17728 [Eleusine coracana subsp. coracana]|uniref:Uncharacterized protein n=1 Tax=Eleusine coracana subsp. coracana TaxID=191504 RepID=A0AAV5CPX8_ELECO|nr:hypothetical protein QOZ80_6AG0513950 [Eleusine coracana subsp. coracana]GJN00306.1 hypothetical protein PR202_ga17481 [Eleusine coracana subsp. coracana]GJN00538.1 hypothetical protein PR202_ga17728 [Eleusine coracana subsp. coracana]
MAKEADPTRCRRHPRHWHAAGVCPFCLRDRLARLSAAAARAEANANAAPSSSMSSGSSSSSPCSYSWEQSVAPPALPPRRRERLGMLLLQEGREAAVLGSAAMVVAPEAEEVEMETTADKKAKRGNFWARLQQQLHHGGWHRKDGCSLTHSSAAVQKNAVAAAARPRREPVV